MKVQLLNRYKQANQREITEWLELMTDGTWMVCEYVDGEFWISREADESDHALAKKLEADPQTHVSFL